MGASKALFPVVKVSSPPSVKTRSGSLNWSYKDTDSPIAVPSRATMKYLLVVSSYFD